MPWLAEPRDELISVRQTIASSAIKVRLIVSITSDGNNAVVEIADHGIGISAEHLPMVQNRFFRVDQARTVDGSNGTGLGLSLVAEFVKLHGGTIDIQSRLDEGTVVRISLPLASDSRWAEKGVPSK